MAFTPATLNVGLDSLAGGSLRFHFYKTADTVATVLGTGYFARANKRGVRLNDIIFVAHSSTPASVSVMRVRAVDASGNATAAIDAGEATQGIVDLRNFGAVADGSAGTGVAAAVTAAVAAGYRRLFLPANCWYYPGNGASTPDNIEIIGENWETSVIASTDQTDAAKDWKLGVHSIIRHVGIRNNFGYRQPPPLNTVKTVPLEHTVNLKNTAQVIANYGFNYLTLIVPASITLPDGTVQTDNQGILIQTEGSGDGAFFATPTGATGVNIRISTQGNADSGILIQNGEANPTLPHYGMHIVETSSGVSGGASIAIDRKGNAINLDINDFASASAPYTNNMIRLLSSQQANGTLQRIYQTNINSAVTLLSLEAGNGGGTYTGDFLSTQKAGVVMHELSASGGIFSGGTAGIGYLAGGTVTQSTDKTTAVTLNKITGQIVMNNASLGANSGVSFTFNNSLLAANDLLILNVKGGATGGSYLVEPGLIAAGAANIGLFNLTTGALAEAVVIGFAIIKGAIA